MALSHAAPMNHRRLDYCLSIALIVIALATIALLHPLRSMACVDVDTYTSDCESNTATASSTE